MPMHYLSPALYPVSQHLELKLATFDRLNPQQTEKSV
jgi:hypothetical protein